LLCKLAFYTQKKSTHPNPIKQNVHITHDLSQLRKKKIKKTKELEERTRVQYLMATNAVPKYARQASNWSTMIKHVRSKTAKHVKR
jgi:hypothetical protein